MRYAPAILVGRLTRFAARLRKPGGGSAVPGLVVNGIAPGYLKRTLSGFPQGLVVVSGSSGKSTTTKMLVAILRGHGVDVFTNPSTANISQGLTSALLERADWQGRVPGDVAVLEMDEGHGALVMQGVDARVVTLTNVMVDQIDRFHDSEMVAGMLGRIAARAHEAVVVNADDAHLERIAAKARPDVAIHRFGVSAEVLERSPRGLGHAATMSGRLSPGAGVVVESVDPGIRIATATVQSADPLPCLAADVEWIWGRAVALSAAFLTGLAHLYNLVPYQRRAQHAGQCGVEVEGGQVPTRELE